MLWTEHLTQSERDELTENLNERQRIFIDAYLKRGRRTVFANVLAMEKAGSVEEGNIEEVADQWELQDYIDAGPRWKQNPQLYCECGRVLRYQYVVQNKETGELKKFGITHFEEHVGIPPHLVKEIVKGIERIDYERDEILMKIAKGWTLAHEGIKNIPAAVEVPIDIQKHFKFGVPLLDRQVRRLSTKISEYFREQERQRREYLREQERQRLEKEKFEKEIARKRKQEAYAKRRQEVAEKSNWNYSANQSLNQSLQLGVMVYFERLDSPYFQASELCKDLVEYHGASNERFSSGGLKIFPEVCNFLEHLVQEGVLEFMGKQDGVDRVYHVLERS